MATLEDLLAENEAAKTRQQAKLKSRVFKINRSIEIRNRVIQLQDTERRLGKGEHRYGEGVPADEA